MLGLIKAIETDERLAYAILGQGLLDEGSILTDKIEIFYNDEGTAWFLFKTAQKVALAQTFRKKSARHQLKFGFTIVRSGWAKLYEMIGPLPDKRKDRDFRFLLRPHPTGALRPVGESKKLLLRALRNGPRTSRELSFSLDISGSTVRRHLSNLARDDKVEMIGRNRSSTRGKNKSAFVWALDNENADAEGIKNNPSA
jgi:DNA-binding transcriptional ArsR family regulator